MMHQDQLGTSSKKNLVFTGVLPQYLEGAIIKCVPFIEKALDRYPGMLKLASVIREIKTGHMQLWVEIEDETEVVGCAVTQIITYEEYKAVRIVLVSGELNDKWAGYLDIIGIWAKDFGCYKLETRGRLGWLKKANKFSLKPVAVVYERILETRH